MMTTASSNDAGTGWTVTGQTQATELADTGGFVSGVTVSFRTGNGVIGSVFVPDSIYNVDTVRQLVSQRAASLDAVHGLTG